MADRFDERAARVALKAEDGDVARALGRLLDSTPTPSSISSNAGLSSASSGDSGASPAVLARRPLRVPASSGWHVDLGGRYAEHRGASAEQVLEHLMRLGATVKALTLAKDRVKATREHWMDATVEPTRLVGVNVFLVGRFLFGCGDAVGSRLGKLHKLITECGGRIQKSDTPNGNTMLVVRGLADDDEHSSCLDEARKVNEKRASKVGGKAALPPMDVYDEVGFSEQLSQGYSDKGSFPWNLRQLYEATALRRQQHTLLRLALASAAWREFEATQPLKGLCVALTGCMLVMSSGEHADTHTELKELIRRCSGQFSPTVTKAGTDLLVIGKGEKGEGGKENGKGEDPRSSQKYQDAIRFNESLEKEGKPCIVILSEEELLPWLMSTEAKECVEHTATREQKAPSVIRPQTGRPRHQPDVRAIRFTSIAQRAHGCGEPGGKGSLLADALAAPNGYTLTSALITAQSIRPSFVWTMLQIASVADGAPPEMEPEVALIVWGPDPVRRSQSDGEPWRALPADGEMEGDPQATAATEPVAAAASISTSTPEGAENESKWLGSGMMEEGAARGMCHMPVGANPHLDRLVELRRKPRLRCAYRLTADTTIEHGHGQVHSKFWCLLFASMCGDGAEIVRLVVSSGNAQSGAYGGMPERRQLLGLWWADFPCRPAAQPASPFRLALLHHIEALLASKKRHGAGSVDNRAAAEALWRRMREAWERADTSPADAAGTTLVSHVPGRYALPAGSAPCGVPMGMAALHECFRCALRHPAERLDLAVIAHCASGWSAGKDGAERVREWCDGAAPNGGQVRFHWPRRGDLSILGKQRATTAPRDGYMDCEAPEWLASLPLVELGLREDVVSKGERSGYQATPHLMLYVLHEPLEADGAHAPRIRRLLLTSANMSAAPWGYAREQTLEIRNFELGVVVDPARPLELVEPLGDLGASGGSGRSQKVWAEAIPFHIEGRKPCEDPYLGQKIVHAQGKAERGQLNY